jgi:predicted  nucleic acid-binding Zn-ribbon protein
MLSTTARRVAGLFFSLAILIVLASAYVALIYHGDLDAGADAIVNAMSFGGWIAVFALLLAFCFLVLFILFLMRVERPATERPLLGNEITITCRDCSKSYVITDTGERPLMHACPHCGFTDEYPPATEATAEAVPAGEHVPEEFGLGTPAKPEALVIHCTSCGTNFETPYTTERPLVTNCANCGRRGILRQPSSAAAPESA